MIFCACRFYIKNCEVAFSIGLIRSELAINNDKIWNQSLVHRPIVSALEILLPEDKLENKDRSYHTFPC